ncbi:sugar ABC transporter substrate-binding protein [Paenibacillus harenae]|uniref:Ribose transport system substrate-binding protein n=1 Tax=Paenibacillus harenae TaxID=306543 RepID=A0ABT9TVT2_PAEHA|nr:substrate-binding domain-containing protein [Paenibacillus harenae]MDQ0111463.1 ribose transport system substrate-binding protein [Paenibacillus harenae]
MANISSTRFCSILSMGLLLPLLLVASGCTANIEQPGEPIAANQTATEGASSHLFGIIYPMAHPYYETVTQAALETAEDYHAKLIVKAPDEANLEQQIRMMETMIKQSVDGIAIDPIDADALAPVIDKAIMAGIPVITFESDSPASKRLSFIGTDNYKAGEQMGQMLDQLLQGRGMIIVETGMAKMRNAHERLNGMLAYIEAQTEIQVLEVKYNEGSDTVALSELEAMIDAHPHFDGFVAIDVISGSTSVLVWKAQGLNRYALTFGMMPEIAEALRNGQLTAALSQNEHMWGTRIIETLEQAASGQDIPKRIETGTTEVTIEDVVQ